MTRWQRYRLLNHDERRALRHAALALPLVSLGLHVAGFERTQRVLTRLSPALPPASPDAAAPPSDFQWRSARLIARMVDAAGREVWPRTRCLERSMAAWWLLRRQRLPATLRIGVRKDDGILRAHAWLEICGEVLNDNAEIYRGYTAFARAIESMGQPAPQPPLQPVA
jgi:hypothetical protein